MCELTLHTGIMGENTTIHIDWFDHNNIRQATKLDIRMQPQDKPRTLALRLNGIVLAVIPPADT